MIKSFEKFNESFADLFRDDRSDDEKFYDNISSALIDIIINEQQISEKSFRQYDIVIKHVKDLMKNESFLSTINETFNDFTTTTKCRPQYWAERIYEELMHREIINTDLSNSV